MAALPFVPFFVLKDFGQMMFFSSVYATLFLIAVRRFTQRAVLVGSVLLAVGILVVGALQDRGVPSIQASNVTIEYTGSGLGFAGDPNGADVSPLVTVKLSNVQFKPLAFLLFATFNMPDFATTLTAEDLSGTESN